MRYHGKVRILGIDTSGAAASVALVDGAQVRAEERLPAQSRASRELLPAIERVLGRCGLGPGEVDGFAAVRGPGSFTGLRVGLATAVGLALAGGRPAAGSSALDLLAEQAPEEAGAVCALIDAGRGEWYAGFYRRRAGSLERQGEYEILTLPALSASLALPIVLVGPGAGRARDILAGCRAEAAIAPHTDLLAAPAARALQRLLASGAVPDPDSLRPLYIRPSEAERTRRWPTTHSASSA